MIAALVGVQIAFASWAIVGKVTVSAVSPTLLVAFRLVGGGVFFLAWALARGAPIVPPAGVRGETVLLALTGLVVNQFLFTVGLHATSAIEASVLTATIPVLTVLYAVLTGHERARRAVWAGVAVATMGAVLVARPARMSLADAHLAGDVMILVNAASYSVYLVRGRAVMARYGAVDVIGWMFMFAMLLAAPWFVVGVVREAGAWSAHVWMSVAYVVLVPTVLAYWLNAWALARAPSSVVAVFVYLQPVLAIAMAVGAGNALAAWLGVAPPNEALSASVIVGMSAVLGGVWIASRRRAGATVVAGETDAVE